MISLFFFYFIVLKYILLILPPKYTLLHHLQCLLSSGHNHPLPWKKHLIYSPVSFFSSLFYSVSAMKGIFVNATVYYTLPQPSFITPSILPTSGPLCVFFFFFFLPQGLCMCCSLYLGYLGSLPHCFQVLFRFLFSETFYISPKIIVPLDLLTSGVS